ncbi:virulence factor TspB C-terminal domain-related protein [Acidithiobacillus sp. HP-11]|uniref:virulence factor TspB C-terminal domain-related protein n=1 Tax=Acidithiobacillus sp. HP-11 TaxID=2697656 RepID=UPI001879095B|nr:virulence factor TspB C-terminal domain-related protein [Acidithiobacillus sp. HP-11]MBE7567479.1 hypothetical protein [Acidithiobacillus sp. HP-11]
MCGLLNTRIFTLFCLSLCILFSVPDASASGAADDLSNPNYVWKMSSDGQSVYRIYSPAGTRASANFNPSSSYAEGSSGGVIDTFAPPPLTIDGATGEVVTSLSRSLTVGDLVDGLGKLMSVDNPIGLTVLGATTVLPIAQAIYDQYESTNSSVPSTSPQQTASTYTCGSTTETSSLPIIPEGTYICFDDSSSTCGISTGCYQTGTNEGDDGCPNGSATAYGGPSCSNGDTPVPNYTSVSGAPTPPSNYPQWVANNWSSDNLSNDASTVLQNNPSYGPSLAQSLSANDASMADTVPYTYTPSSNSLSEPSSSSSSTDPSTGDTTTTTSTPSFTVSPGANGGLQVTKNLTQVTSSCTSSGSCTTTNTTVASSTPTNPTPFTAPTVSFGTSGLSTATADMPQSMAFSNIGFGSSWLPDSCPPAPTWDVTLPIGDYNQSFTLPTQYLCDIASDFKPIVLASGGVVSLFILAW